MNYKNLSREDFDAIVTGELTHYAIWLEDEIVQILADHYSNAATRPDFVRLILRRDGLTFQHKIEIARATLPLFRNQVAARTLKGLLNRVEAFKGFRNAFAHGLDETPDGIDGEIHVGLVNRAGKETIRKVTPESHEAMMDTTESLLSQLKSVRDALGSMSSQG
ncbi:hypothetical protein [Burkholderia contaminans]|uniref:hypothetical protein n=1 Tax=Burkholderia contaminans TaxID=488447 RepID=UPI000F597559|nr:hypothetical protein [Burkholderia contaminans]